MKETTHPIVELIYNGYSFWPKKKFTTLSLILPLLSQAILIVTKWIPTLTKSNLFILME
jgi:hypothetical protein